MTVTRRTLLKVAGLLSASVPLSGCEKVISLATEQMGETIPVHVKVPQKSDIDDHFHLLSRAAYGPWPGDLDYVQKIGKVAWLHEQLDYEHVKDDACQLRAKRFETIHLDPGTCFEFRKEVLARELAAHSIVRAVYSKRQLYEVMVGFWSDHLNISINKGECLYFKPADDRLVIRPHALGKFRDLIHASVLSPAMLVYLDGKENKKPRPDSIPNENAARELLELHTLGVHGGYTQKDVYEVARCLTGWTIQTGWQKGKENFDPSLHDNGEKVVLGHKIPGGLYEKDLERLLDIVCFHPSTALHIATKMVHKFVSDDPPERLVQEIGEIFTRTKGDIKAMTLALFMSNEFAQSQGEKLKRPFHFVVSSLRMTGADTYAHEQLIEYVSRMGQGPFAYPTPDGYPDKPEPWLGTMLWRWNFISALVSNGIPSVEISLDKLLASIQAKPDATVQSQSEASRSERGKIATDKIATDKIATHNSAIKKSLASKTESSKTESSKTAESSKTESSRASRGEPRLAISDVSPVFSYFTGRVPNANELKAFEKFLAAQRKNGANAEIVGLILASPAFQRC